MRPLVLSLLLSLAIAPPTIFADPGLEPGQFGLFADLEGTDRRIAYFPFVPFEFHLLVEAPVGGIRAWELGLDMPPEVVILAVELDDPLSVNVGTPPNLIVGMHSGCIYPGKYRLATIRALTTDMSGGFAGQICPTAATPSAFVPPVAGYLDCMQNLVPMTFTAPGFETGEGCVLIGDGLCGSLLPARTFLWLEDSGGPVGATVDVPITATSGAYLDCDAIPRPMDSITFDVRWELSEVALLGASTGDLPEDWTVTVTQLADGAQVHFAGTSSIEIPFELFPLGSLSYRLADVPTETELLVTSVSVSSGLEAYPGMDNPATLTSGIIATVPESFGALKAKFRE